MCHTHPPTHTRTHPHTHAPTHTHTQTRTHRQTDTHTQTYTYAHTITHIRMPTNTHRNTYKYTHTHTHTCPRTQRHYRITLTFSSFTYSKKIQQLTKEWICCRDSNGSTTSIWRPLVYYPLGLQHDTQPSSAPHVPNITMRLLMQPLRNIHGLEARTKVFQLC